MYNQTSYERFGTLDRDPPVQAVPGQRSERKRKAKSVSVRVLAWGFLLASLVVVLTHAV